MRAHCIGVAGYMGAGKSTISRLIAGRGITLIDADNEAKIVMQRDSAIRKQLILTFGNDVVANDTVRSDLLGERAFRSAEDLAALNAIVHPAIVAHLEKLIDNCDTGKCILDAALIPMWNVSNRFDFCIWV